MQEDLRGEEPTLSAEAGLTEGSAKAAGAAGYADEKLHAGFITKQTLCPPGEAAPAPTAGAPAPAPAPSTEGIVLDLEPAVEGEPALSSEAGLTVESAKAAGDHGHADTDLNAGFISKQTPLP